MCSTKQGIIVPRFIVIISAQKKQLSNTFQITSAIERKGINMLQTPLLQVSIVKLLGNFL